jgi:hypothetical protein
VAVFDHTGVQVGYDVAANADGSDSIGDLAPGDYRVCYDAGDPHLSPPYGYVNQCYHGVAWNSGYGPPAGAKSVTVRAGATTTDIDATLATAGGRPGRSPTLTVTGSRTSASPSSTRWARS